MVYYFTNFELLYVQHFVNKIIVFIKITGIRLILSILVYLKEWNERSKKLYV